MNLPRSSVANNPTGNSSQMTTAIIRQRSMAGQPESYKRTQIKLYRR